MLRKYGDDGDGFMDEHHRRSTIWAVPVAVRTMYGNHLRNKTRQPGTRDCGPRAMLQHRGRGA